ncbi:hypothetical protein Uis4E_1242 [Bifidobacterium parmae]|uniref:Uncharacterized protein n=1 Tax=Bifidobacterium parmae TaxID=361854 RepID=A0A2N5J333_9BIFI|nr:hypothetical protein Uis4E_1242 [Bifidobacterium parmae]
MRHPFAARSPPNGSGIRTGRPIAGRTPYPHHPSSKPHPLLPAHLRARPMSAPADYRRVRSVSTLPHIAGHSYPLIAGPSCPLIAGHFFRPIHHWVPPPTHRQTSPSDRFPPTASHARHPLAGSDARKPHGVGAAPNVARKRRWRSRHRRFRAKDGTQPMTNPLLASPLCHPWHGNDAGRPPNSGTAPSLARNRRRGGQSAGNAPACQLQYDRLLCYGTPVAASRQ